MTYYMLTLLVLVSLAFLSTRRDGGAATLAAYAAVVICLAMIMLGMRLAGLGLFYLFCALGFVPVLFLGEGRSAPRLRDGGRRAGRRLGRFLPLLLPLVLITLALGFFTIIKGIGPAFFSATPMSLTNLLVRKGHCLELVGVFLIIFSLVYHSAVWREER